MATLLASRSIDPRYLRDERWDIIGHAIERLEEDSKSSLNIENLTQALRNAGAVYTDQNSNSVGRFVPSMLLRPIAEGCSKVYIECYDDSSIVVRRELKNAPQERVA